MEQACSQTDHASLKFSLHTSFEDSEFKCLCSRLHIKPYINDKLFRQSDSCTGVDD